MKEFISPMLAVVDKPRKKFLKQALPAILLAGSLRIKDMARWIHDDCSDIFYQIKRLTNHLISSKATLDMAVEEYRKSCSKHIHPDTPIIIDLTDLAKPRARKMEYLNLVYDGSEDQLVNGYWCLEVYAHLKKKCLLPLAMDAFSTDDPDIKSRNHRIDCTVRAVDKALNGKGIWIADRGFDALELYKTWFSINSNFVVRQRSDRCVVTSNGIQIVQSQLVEHLRQLQVYAKKQTRIVFTKVRLPKRSEWLYLVASWKPGHEKPLILMTTMVVENLRQARQILWYYSQRWSCEESGRFLKSKIGLERFCVRRYESIKRLMILAMFAMGFLSWILIRSRSLTRGLFAMTSKFRPESKFVYYRLLEGLQQLILKHRLRAAKIPLIREKNG